MPMKPPPFVELIKYHDIKQITEQGSRD